MPLGHEDCLIIEYSGWLIDYELKYHFFNNLKINKKYFRKKKKENMKMIER